MIRNRNTANVRNLNESWIDKVQLALDGLGLIPGAGEVADAANAIISLVRGNPLEATLSAISMVPGAGDAVGKGGKAVLKIMEPVMPLIKQITKGGKGKDLVKKIGPEVLEKLAEHADAIRELKDFVAKHSDGVQKILDMIKSGKSDDIMKMVGLKEPLTGKSKKIVEFIMKKVGDMIPDVKTMISELYDFLADLTEEKLKSAKKNKEEDEEVKSESFLYESYSVRRVLMTDAMINDALREAAGNLRRS